MTRHVQFACPDHEDPADCPDALVGYVPKFDEYGIRVHDGGSSAITIEFRPWCGSRLPRSRRDEWFERMAALGVGDPFESEIPAEFTSDDWYRDA
ncbi:MAG: hypothetical protein MUQ30_02570 [Anaerolineae bacterium]|nr:hypothetical protein [Anaerolineae bacterium]